MIFPPGLLLILGGLCLPLLRAGRLRAAAVLALPLLTLGLVWQVPATGGGEVAALSMLGLSLQLVEAQAYSHIFATVFCLAAFGGGLFWIGLGRGARPHLAADLPASHRTLEISSAYAYAGGAVGVAFAGDLFTLFIFWELMALGSTLVIWSAGTDAARRAGMRYAFMHFVGGVFLLAGIAGMVVSAGSYDIAPLSLAYEGLGESYRAMLGAGLLAESNRLVAIQELSAALILLGILVNLAAPPFSSWLPDAYPETSPSGMVFLSAFTTKTAVYVLLTLFAGQALLIPIGLFMVFYGIVYAILENDMRRILAYSIINQVGFMVTGIGIGTEMALNGAAAHAFCHIIYKALLLMSAGSVLAMTGRRKCSDLGGLYHSMRLTCICGIIGALAISAFPLTSGFISKSMISQAAADQHLLTVWLLLAAASAGVFLHAGIKFPWFVFFQKDSGLRPADPPASMRVAMLLFSAFCLIPGIWPEAVYWMLPVQPEYEPNTAAHFVTQTQLLLFSGLAFFLLLPLLKRTETISLDLDWLYRVAALRLLQGGEKIIAAFWRHLTSFLRDFAVATGWAVREITHPAAPAARSYTTSAALLVLGIVLIVALAPVFIH